MTHSGSGETVDVPDWVNDPEAHRIVYHLLKYEGRLSQVVWELSVLEETVLTYRDRLEEAGYLKADRSGVVVLHWRTRHGRVLMDAMGAAAGGGAQGA